MKAKMADSFVESIGVVTNLTYFDSPYGQYAEIVKPLLLELGVRHIRDGLPLMIAPSEKAIRLDNLALLRMRDLGKYGIRVTLHWEGNPISVIKALTGNLIKIMDAAEGPNEPDIPQSKFFYKEQKGVGGAKIFQKELYEAIKGDETLKDLPVILFSLGSEKDIEEKGIGEMDKYCDYGNLHIYPGVNPPGSSIDVPISVFRSAIPNKPIILTEVGYTTVGEKAVSENAQARYILRILLESWIRDIPRTFIYELVDSYPKELPRSGFGLIRFDGSPRPSFHALKNMIDILKDPGDEFETGSLDISLEKKVETVHQILLQKRDGTFYLLIWNEVKSFDPVKKKDIGVKEQRVKIILKSRISEANIYQPLKSSKPVRKISEPKTITLSVPDHPIIVELKPISP